MNINNPRNSKLEIGDYVKPNCKFLQFRKSYINGEISITNSEIKDLYKDLCNQKWKIYQIGPNERIVVQRDNGTLNKITVRIIINNNLKKYEI